MLWRFVFTRQRQTPLTPSPQLACHYTVSYLHSSSYRCPVCSYNPHCHLSPSCLHFTALFFFSLNPYLPLCVRLVSSHLAASLQHVTVCVSCLSPEVYLGYLWGRVTMANPVFRWLFSTTERRARRTGGELLLQDSLTRGHLRHCRNTHTRMHMQKRAHTSRQISCTCVHTQSNVFHTQTLSLTHIEPAYLSQVAQPSSLSSPCSSLSAYCTTPLLVFLCPLSFPDQSDSCSH